MKISKPLILQVGGNTEEQEFLKWHVDDFYGHEDIDWQFVGFRLSTYNLFSAVYLLGII